MTIDMPIPAQVNPQDLGQIIQEWRRLEDEISNHKQAAREKGKRLKILESIIMNIMKQNSIDAVNLNNTGGRIVYKKRTSKESLAPRTLERLLGEHFKNDTLVADALKFINENRSTKVHEAIRYEAGF